MLGRDTRWKQGSVLAQTDAITIGLFDEASSNNKRAIVITHDCDLLNEKEKNVEVIVGNEISEINQSYARARNVRCLHMTFEISGNEKASLELSITAKQSICKSCLENISPDDVWVISDDEKRAFKQWLAARYGRPAFPNAFEVRLRKIVYKKYSVEHELNKALEKVSTHLIGVFFDLGESRAVELVDGTPYVLGITVVYDANEGGESARLAAETAATKIEDIFQTAYGPPEVATEIALDRCEAIADTFFSLSDLRKVDQWRAEYISLRQDPQEEFLAVGEVPV